MKKKIFIITFLCMIAFAAMIVSDKIYKSADMTERVLEDNSISKYAGKVAIPINGNKPFWSAEEYTTESFEEYSELDEIEVMNCEAEQFALMFSRI